MLDRLVAFVAAIGFATALVLLTLWLVKQRERREDRIYASLAYLPLAEEWRGRLAARVRSSLLTGHCDVIVGACLPSTRELAELIDRLRRAVPQAVRVTVDLVTPQDGRLVVAFVGSKELSSPARPKDAPPAARSAPRQDLPGWDDAHGGPLSNSPCRSCRKRSPPQDGMRM